MLCKITDLCLIVIFLGPFQIRRDTGDVIVAEELNTVAGQIKELEMSVSDGVSSSNVSCKVEVNFLHILTSFAWWESNNVEVVVFQICSYLLI